VSRIAETAPPPDVPVEEKRRRVPAVPSWLRPDPLHMLGAVLVGAALVRAYRLRTPPLPVIFDETFYVNAVRIIRGLNVPAGLPYSGAPQGLDPNLEHPPLGKAFIDASMWAFGDNGFGWRLPSLLLGIASVVLVYAIVRRLSPDGWLAVLAATIFAFDNLVFVHSRIATLDMPMLTFMLLAVWFWFRGWHLAAGIACGIALLVKLPAVLGLGALVLLGLGPVVIRAVRDRELDIRALRPTAALVLASAVVFLGGLWLLDLAFTQYAMPWAHLRHMWDFGFAVNTRHGAASNTSKPWWWLINEVKMTYYNQGVKLTVNGHQVGSRTDVNFLGVMNPFVAGAAPLAVSYAAWRAWRLRDALSVFVLVWIATNYLIYYPLVLIEQRTTYFYYILPTVAAYAIAIAQLLREPRLPRAVTWGYLAMFFVGFALYYPFRGIF
jgi:4-amino-4-deoxy-L-arabinose transferase-like glycosyltransferase